MIGAGTERRLLQAVILIAGFVPVLAGGAGMILGAAMVPGGVGADLSLDSHVRYLSGLLFGIGVAFWISIPRIEAHSGRVRVLAAIVVCGGLARLAGLWLAGAPDLSMRLALIMELIVTPAIAIWQARVARRSVRP